MPTKSEIIWMLVGYGYERHFISYLDQYFDRFFLDVRKKYPSRFEKIELDGNSYNYSPEQTILILDELRLVTDKDATIPGYNLNRYGCTSVSVSRALYDYREKVNRSNI